MTKTTMSSSEGSFEPHDALMNVVRLLADDGSEEVIIRALEAIFEFCGARSIRLIQEGGWAAGLGAASGGKTDEYFKHYVQQHGGMDVTPVSDLAVREMSDEVQYVTAFPLRAGGRGFGVLWLGFSEQPEFEADTLDTLQMMVTQVSHGLASLAHNTMVMRCNRLEGMIASMVEPIILLDKDGRILAFNPAAGYLFNIDPAQALGQKFDIVANHAELSAYISGDMPQDDFSRLFVSFGEGTFQPHVTAVKREDGDADDRLVVLMDVSHYKLLNENMMLFLQTVSHDLRSPLTAAKGFVDMMPMVGDLNPRQLDMKEKVLTSITDMTNLVEKVLDAGRLDPEMGDYQLRRDLCDPSQIVEKVISNLTAAAQKKQLQLVSSVSPDVPIMNLDEMMIDRALTNLVENAIKYTPEGGVISVNVLVQDNRLKLQVEDNGLGIPKEQQISLFERGIRLRRKEHKAIRGSGLGLFIVKNVAQQHGGEATLESIEGEGSRFTISIPITGLNSLGGD